MWWCLACGGVLACSDVSAQCDVVLFALCALYATYKDLLYICGILAIDFFFDMSLHVIKTYWLVMYLF